MKEESSDEDEADDEEEEVEYGSEPRHTGGGGAGGGGDDSSSESSESSDSHSASTVSDKKKKKKSKSKSKKSKSKAKEDLVATLGEDYEKKYITETIIQKDKLLKRDGTYDGDVNEEESARLKIIRKINELCVLRVKQYSNPAEVANLFKPLTKMLEIMKLEEHKGPANEEEVNEAGRDAIILVENVFQGCETALGPNLYQATVNVAHPFPQFIELNRQAALEISIKKKKLKETGIIYGEREVFSKEEVGSMPSHTEVEKEKKRLFSKIETKLGSEYRKHLMTAATEELRRMIQIAYEEKKAQTLSGFDDEVQIEYEKRKAAYLLVLKKLASRQRKMSVLEEEYLQVTKLQTLYENIQAFNQQVFLKLKAGMQGIVYARVKGILEKKVRISGTDKDILTAFTAGDLPGVYANLKEYFFKASIVSFFNFKERKFAAIQKASKEHDYPVQQQVMNKYDREEEQMNYKKMPYEMHELAVWVQSLEEELKKEAIRKICEFTPDLKKKTSNEVGAYLAGLNLKAKLEAHVDAYYQAMQSGNGLGGAKKKFHRGFSGELDGDTDETGMYTNDKSNQKKSSKKEADGSAKKPKPFFCDRSMEKNWVQCGTRTARTNYTGVLPIPKAIEIQVKDNVYVCMGNNSKQSSRFTSVTTPCEKCSNSAVKGHTPMCFIKTCNKCGRYGHAEMSCLHEE